jgi:hypothetical protein
MSDKKWYQFELTINHKSLVETKIKFPEKPQNYPPAGEKIHQFLVQSGMILDSEQESCFYVASNENVNLANLINLQAKFSHQGATIKQVGTGIIIFPEWVSKEEFERFKEETKKSLLLNEKELTDLEQQLRASKG